MSILNVEHLTHGFGDRAIFNDTQLAGTDFRTAYNYSIDPEFNPMKKAKFTTQGIVGLLDKYDIKIE